MICWLLTNELTDSNMKRLANTSTAVALWTMAVFCLESCIFDAPGDKFYRTLWECTEVPLGPFDVNELTLEFLCGNAISLKTDTSPGIIYGTYDSDGETAIFHDLVVELQGLTVTFIDAQLSGSILFLRWRVENSIYPFTTPMHRQSTYN